DPWTISARYFSSEIALGILARMSVKTVRSLGIDGGSNYSQAFSDLQKETLLVNGQPSFDLQFPQLAAIAKEYQLDFQPLFKLNGADREAPDKPPSAVQPIASSQHVNKREISTAAKIQQMEQDLRNTSAKLAETEKQLSIVSKGYRIVSDRLGWAHDEIK